MLYQELLTCSLVVVVVSGQRNSKSIDAQPRLGYSTSIVHSIPGFRDADAESSVKFNFQSGENRDRYTKNTSNAPSSKIFTRTSLSGDSNNPNSFNVGYNLTFNDNNFNVPKTEPIHNYVHNKKFVNAEVITGRSKKNEKVRAPSINTDLSARDFVVSALLKNNQLNLGSARVPTSARTKVISTNTIFPTREQVPKYSSQFSTFAYDTQQKLFKDVAKTVKPEPIQRSPEPGTAFERSYRWRKIKPDPQSYINTRQVEAKEVDKNSGRSFEPNHASSFNHEAALRNGHIFSFNDVHNGVSFENTNVADNFPAGSEVFNQKAKTYDVRENSGANSGVDDIHNLQQNSEISKINIEAHIPKNLRGIKPLPIDTSLLKDPVLTTSYKEVVQNPKVIPIHFDIRPIQNIMQKELSKPQSFTASQNPLRQNLASSSNNVALEASLAHEDHNSSPSETNFRIYGKPEPVGEDKYRIESGHGKRHSNYDEDVYKIVSLRPPPIGQTVVY